MVEKQSLVKDLAHVAVLLILLVVLLVIVTKFKVIHPSVIPGWQGVYCTYIEQKHSVVGFVYGADGAGDPEALVTLLSNTRPTMRSELVQLEDITPGLLSRYEVLVLEKDKTVSFRALSALSSYLDSGGTVIWVGDSLSHQVLDSRDLEEARQLNATKLDWVNRTGKDYYSWFLEKYQNQIGFGEFGNQFFGGYLRTEKASGASTLNPVIRDHLLLSGIPRVKFARGTSLSVVNQNDGVNMLANIEHNGQTFPGILEIKYVGRILYFAFPLEALDSQTFLDNIFDYLVTC